MPPPPPRRRPRVGWVRRRRERRHRRHPLRSRTRQVRTHTTQMQRTYNTIYDTSTHTVLPFSHTVSRRYFTPLSHWSVCSRHPLALCLFKINRRGPLLGGVAGLRRGHGGDQAGAPVYQTEPLRARARYPHRQRGHVLHRVPEAEYSGGAHALHATAPRTPPTPPTPRCYVYAKRRCAPHRPHQPHHPLQVVLKTYMHPLEVLTSFDIDCCTYGFDGTAVVSTARGIRSASTRCNTVDLHRRSQTYERYIKKIIQIRQTSWCFPRHTAARFICRRQN